MPDTNTECGKNEDKQNLHFWLALKLIPRLSIKKKIKLVEKFGLSSLFNSPPSQKVLSITDKQYHALIKPNWDYINNIVSQSNKVNAQIITFDDVCYPRLLKEIYDPPLVLFLLGNAELLNHDQVAIVGSRGASVYGREKAYSFAFQLSRLSITVTSGLALGIDASAHSGALTQLGKTIGIIACGIDIIYPLRHRALYREIIEQGGAIVTEFLPGIQPKPGHFPKRNRLISGMSKGVLVVEAEVKSGSLVTAKNAIEQNRDVFAIPGSIDHHLSKGCHLLIKQGAKLVEELADIIEEINFSPNIGLNYNCEAYKKLDSKKNRAQDLYNDPLLASVGYETTPVDKVVSRCKRPIEEVLTRLTMLELRGLVSAVPGGYLKLHRG